MTAYLIDALGTALEIATSSLSDKEETGELQLGVYDNRAKSIVGVEVEQVVDLLSIQGLVILFVVMHVVASPRHAQCCVLFSHE